MRRKVGSWERFDKCGAHSHHAICVRDGRKVRWCYQTSFKWYWGMSFGQGLAFPLVHFCPSSFLQWRFPICVKTFLKTIVGPCCGLMETFEGFKKKLVEY
jgi:hypothetical protein